MLIAVRDQRLAGYLLLPTDIGEAPVDPPTAPLPAPVNITDPTALDAFAEAAPRLLDTAGGTGDVSVLGELLVHRQVAAAQLANLLSAGPLQHATLMWGKSLVDGSDPYYLGTYAGAASEPGSCAARSRTRPFWSWPACNSPTSTADSSPSRLPANSPSSSLPRSPAWERPPSRR